MRHDVISEMVDMLANDELSAAEYDEMETKLEAMLFG